MMKNLALAIMMVGITGLVGCAEHAGDGSHVRVVCADGTTCDGTTQDCGDTCAAVATEADAVSASYTSQPLTPLDVKVTCCGTTCEGSPSECAEFCKSACPIIIIVAQ